jgi:hypothetical protein
MGRAIKMVIGDLILRGELHKSRTAELIWNVLPIDAVGETWGEEIYFKIPVKSELGHSAVSVVEPGDLAYWPPGEALCVFFGPTPMSSANEIRPASAVEVVGCITGTIPAFSTLKDTRIRIERGNATG